MVDLQINLKGDDGVINGINDCSIVNHDLVLISENDYVTQKIRINLQMIKGEYFLNQSMGLPFFTDMSQKNPDLQKIDAIFKSTITGTRGVVSLDSYSSSFDIKRREFTIEFSCTSDYGTIPNTKVVL